MASVTVRFTDTPSAFPGTPNAPAIGSRTVVPPGTGPSPPSARRESKTRVGAMPWNAAPPGPNQPVRSTTSWVATEVNTQIRRLGPRGTVTALGVATAGRVLRFEATGFAVSQGNAVT